MQLFYKVFLISFQPVLALIDNGGNFEQEKQRECLYLVSCNVMKEHRKDPAPIDVISYTCDFSVVLKPFKRKEVVSDGSLSDMS